MTKKESYGIIIAKGGDTIRLTGIEKKAYDVFFKIGFDEEQKPQDRMRALASLLDMERERERKNSETAFDRAISSLENICAHLN